MAAWVIGTGLVAGFLAPIGVLWCPGAKSLRAHSYRWLMYAQLAQRLEQGSPSAEDLIDRVAEYIQTHLWPAADGMPYDGKPLDYLVKGVGWCDYMSKTHLRLLAVRDIPARYAMLREADGSSPHTTAEVYYQGAWGVHDVLFGVRFIDASGVPLTLQQLSVSPEGVDRQPMFRLEERAKRSFGSTYKRASSIPPRRSYVNTQRLLTPFDRLLIRYVNWGGQPFVNWYQDRYLASTGLDPSRPADLLTLARHWHLANRAELAKAAYLRCLEADERAVRADAQFWLGLLQWELEGDPAAALEHFQALPKEDPDSHWIVLAWYYGGRCEEALGHLEQARELYERAFARELWAAWPRLQRIAKGSG